MNLREKIDLKPMSGYQWFIVFMTMSMNILDGYDVLALAFTATSVRNEFSLTGAELGLLLSAGLIGMALGSLFLAPIADKIGRRPMLAFSIFLSAIGMLGSAYANHQQILALWRVVTGLGVGGILVGTNVITSEYASRKWRNLAISIYVTGFPIGAVLGATIASTLQAQYGWRSVFFFGAALSTIFLIILLIWLPESIDYLTGKQPKNAKQRLELILAKIGVTGKWEMPAKITNTVQRPPLIQLFNPQYVRSTLLIWTAFFCDYVQFLLY